MERSRTKWTIDTDYESKLLIVENKEFDKIPIKRGKHSIYCTHETGVIVVFWANRNGSKMHYHDSRDKKLVDRQHIISELTRMVASNGSVNAAKEVKALMDKAMPLPLVPAEPARREELIEL